MLTSFASSFPFWTSDPVFVVVTVLASLLLGLFVYAAAKLRGADGAAVLGVMVAVVALIDPLSGGLATVFLLVYVYVQSS